MFFFSLHFRSSEKDDLVIVSYCYSLLVDSLIIVNIFALRGGGGELVSSHEIHTCYEARNHGPTYDLTGITQRAR